MDDGGAPVKKRERNQLVHEQLRSERKHPLVLLDYFEILDAFVFVSPQKGPSLDGWRKA